MRCGSDHFQLGFLELAVPRFSSSAQWDNRRSISQGGEAQMRSCRTLGTVPGAGEALSARSAVIIFSDNSKRRGRRRREEERKGEAGRLRSRREESVMGRVQELWEQDCDVLRSRHSGWPLSISSCLASNRFNPAYVPPLREPLRDLLLSTRTPLLLGNLLLHLQRSALMDQWASVQSWLKLESGACQNPQRTRCRKRD